MTDLAATAFVSRLDKTGPVVWTALDGENRAYLDALAAQAREDRGVGRTCLSSGSISRRAWNRPAAG